MSLEQRVERLITEFQACSDWEDRYKHIIAMGKDLDAMPEELKVEQNRVKGCQSQVWLFAQDNPDGTITFLADSDASIAKGIIALLLSVYSGATPPEILGLGQEFIEKLGLKQHLSMNRSNGLNAMLKQIQFYAIALQAKMQMGPKG